MQSVQSGQYEGSAVKTHDVDVRAVRELLADSSG